MAVHMLINAANGRRFHFYAETRRTSRDVASRTKGVEVDVASIHDWKEKAMSVGTRNVLSKRTSKSVLVAVGLASPAWLRHMRRARQPACRPAGPPVRTQLDRRPILDISNRLTRARTSRAEATW